jgi:hypothetical protein
MTAAMVALPLPAAAGDRAPVSLQKPSASIASQADRHVRAEALRVPAAPLRAAQSSRRGGRRGAGRIILGAAVGATAGFFGGGYLGAAIDGDCGGCDDPGLKGALIGAPIGAVAGGILGGKFLF